MAKFNPKLELNLNTLSATNLTPAIARTVRPQLKTIEFKTLFANRVIDEIYERTQEGVDKKDKKFTAYSKSYTKSQIFEVYKGGQENVDLTLTGSMLSSLDSKLNGNNVIIFFNDDTDAAKAHGHINGTKVLPKRDFFGLPKDVLNNLFKESVKDYIKGNLDESEDISARDLLAIERLQNG